MGYTTFNFSKALPDGTYGIITGFINGVQSTSFTASNSTTTVEGYFSTSSPIHYPISIEININTNKFYSTTKVWLVEGTTYLSGFLAGSGTTFAVHSSFKVPSTTAPAFQTSTYYTNNMYVGSNVCFQVQNVTGIATFSTSWAGTTFHGTTYCYVIKSPKSFYAATATVTSENTTSSTQTIYQSSPSSSLGINVSESTTLTIVGQDSGSKFSIGVLRDLSSTFNYYMYYSDLNGTTLVNSSTLSSDSSSPSQSFIISPVTSPNDNSLGEYYFKFAYEDSYGNFSTSSVFYVKIVNIFAAILTVASTGELAFSTSSTKWYYVSPLENPLFLTYIQWRQTAIVQTNFSYAFYLNNVLSNKILASTVVLSSENPPVYQLLGADYVNKVNNTTYVFSVMANRISTTPSYSTSNLIALYWNDPLTVSISTTSVEITAGKAFSTTLKAQGYGGGISTQYDYSWFKNGVKTGVTTQTYNISTTSNVGENYTLFALVESVETKESLSTSPVNVVVKSPISVKISPSSLSGGLVGKLYTFYSEISGGVSPYTYSWYYSTTSNIVGTSPSLNFSTTVIGSNSLGVIVTDSNGAKDNVSISATFYDYPISTLSANTVAALTSSTITLTDTSQGSDSERFTFYVNGKSVSTISDGVTANFNFSTTLAGTYTIYCQVEDLNTLVLQNSNILQLEIFASVGVDISSQYSTTVITTNNIFMATGVGGYPPYHYTWYYNTSNSYSGAIKFSSTQSANFTTTVAGTYYVFAHLSDSASSPSSANSSIKSILEVNKPYAIISGETSSNAKILLTWTSDIIGGSGDYSYTWYLNGSTDTSNGNYTSSTFSTTFSTDGTYVLNLEVYDKGYHYNLPLSNTLTIIISAAASKILNIEDTLTMHGYISSIEYSPVPPTSTTSLPFTVLVNGKDVHAMNIVSEKNIDVAGELDFTVVKRYMYSTTNGVVSFMAVGDLVEFYLYNTLVFSGNIQNISMKSNMQYDIQAYDALYYLAGTRFEANIGSPYNPLDLGGLFGKLVSYSTLAYNFTKTGYGGFSANILSNQSVYYQFLQLATILGYGTYVDNNNTLHLQPLIGTTSTTFTENVNCIFSTTLNDTNYFYNTVNLIANSKQSIDVCSTTNLITTCETISTTILSTTILSTTITGASATAKKIDLNWLSVNGGGTWIDGKSVSLESLADIALERFTEGYREIKVWYSLSGANATTFLNIGYNGNITAKFVDGRNWTNLFISRVTINSTGMYLTLVNFPKDIWSQIDSITSHP
jgi:hypothetical protein